MAHVTLHSNRHKLYLDKTSAKPKEKITLTREELDCDTRLRATFENGTLNGFKIARRYPLVLQLNSASKLALKAYRQNARRSARD